METVIDILTSPVWWSTGVCIFAIIVGYRHYSEKIRNEDQAIRESRKKAIEEKKS